MSWSSQDHKLLQGYRRTYRLDTPSAFKNPLSHVILGNGVGRYSPTMARPKSKRRVQKDQLALAVRKNFNALGVSETDVIVDMLYKTKHQGTTQRDTESSIISCLRFDRQRVSSSIRTAEIEVESCIPHRCTLRSSSDRYPTTA